MKKLFLSLLCAMCVWTVNAQTTYLRISQLDGYTIKVPVGHIDSIDFVTTDEEPTTPEEPSKPNFNGHEYVDLGLPSGTLWATCNIGADSPELFGYYFAWGETSTKDDYSWETYAYGTNLTKYNGLDGLTKLELKDDAARVNWGGTWRMPTAKEVQELLDNCTWEWTYDYDFTGVKGYIGTSKVDTTKQIFLPATGFRENMEIKNTGSTGHFWSSSLCTSNLQGAFLIEGYERHSSKMPQREAKTRYLGYTVRPVCSPAK